jgi:hypothetical protein
MGIDALRLRKRIYPPMKNKHPLLIYSLAGLIAASPVVEDLLLSPAPDCPAGIQCTLRELVGLLPWSQDAPERDNRADPPPVARTVTASTVFSIGFSSIKPG